MKIQLTDKYVLTSNEYNLILNEVRIPLKGKFAGVAQLDRIAYFGKLSLLIKWLVEHEMQSSTTTSLEALQADMTLFIESLKGTAKIIEKKWTEKKPY